MKQASSGRRILHVDLAPFFVGVERARDHSLRDRALVIGALGERGRVAGVSAEARTAGVEVGQLMALARRLCPEAVFLPGDIETYAHVSDQVTAILTTFTPRVERPSVDEAFADLSPAAGTTRRALATAESLRDVIQQRLGLDCSFGLGSSRLAARIASRWARPRGLLLLWPEHETSFLDRQLLPMLDDLSPGAAATLTQAGITTLGHVRATPPEQLRALLGRAIADGLRASLDPGLAPPIAPIAAPHSVREDHVLRDRAADRVALSRILDGLVLRAAKRLATFQANAQAMSVEVQRGETWLRSTERFCVTTYDVAALQAAAQRLSLSLLDPAVGVRALRVRLSATASAP
jgi:DNA polymerase-4